MIITNAGVYGSNSQLGSIQEVQTLSERVHHSSNGDESLLFRPWGGPSRNLCGNPWATPPPRCILKSSEN